MTITYKTAKKLKEFLGESYPEPIVKQFWIYEYPNNAHDFPFVCDGKNFGKKEKYPAYSLEDLLSKPFCEAMSKVRHTKELPALWCEEDTDGVFAVFYDIANAYHDGGMEAVEKCLCELMDGK